MTNPALGTKRNCPHCNSPFYDLNKSPAHCPKCKHEFDPAITQRPKKKATKQAVKADDQKAVQKFVTSKLAEPQKKKEKKPAEDKDAAQHDIEAMDDLEGIDDINDLSELEEVEDEQVNEDDADDEAILEELDAGDKNLVDNVEEQEAEALVEEIEDAQVESKKKPKNKKLSK